MRGIFDNQQSFKVDKRVKMKNHRVIILSLLFIACSLGHCKELSKEGLQQTIDNNNNNWKGELNGLLMESREQIEAMDDEQMYKSSIAISHIDNALEIINSSQEYSKKIEKDILSAIQAKKDFEAGLCPEFVRGLNRIKLRRFENGEISEFALNVPENYDSSQKWPVYIHVDPTRWSVNHYGKKDGWSRHIFHDGMIDVWWHSVTHKNMRWKDHVFFMEMLKNQLNIDRDRVYIYGLCGNGIAAMALAVNYPDYWAQASFSTGNSFRHLAGNSINLPVIYDNAHPENQIQSAYMDFAVKCFEYFGCQKFKYTTSPQESVSRGADIPTVIRNKSPLRVFHTIENMHNSKSYWVSINGREDENYVGGIDAIVWGQKIFVKTNNIDAYTLNLCDAPIDANRPVEIVENDKSLGEVVSTEFVRRSEKYKNTKYVKNEKICGPIKDMFNDPFVFVISSADSNEASWCRKTAENIFKNATVIFDVNVTDEIISEKNLIVIGTRENNTFLNKIADNLPIQIIDGVITADNIELNGVDGGTIFIHPNPFNKEKYITIFTVNTAKGLGALVKVYAIIKSDKLVDVIVFEIVENGNIKFHIKEKFNSIWKLHKNHNKVLIQLDEMQPKWKWLQYFAKATRKELGADIAIFEDVFCEKEVLGTGEITFRQVCNSIDNKWIVNVSIKGKQIKKILSVPFESTEKRKVEAPVIEGISFVKNDENGLSMSELKNEEIYTVAMPYKMINGKRMGAVMKDYRIVGDGWLELLVKDHIVSKGTEAVEELKKIKPRIF